METKPPDQHRVLTIPNILTVIRLLMIPVILWLALAKEEYVAAAIVLFASGVTDVVDGFIARKFHMTSNVGRILDPVADKLTQLSALACLCSRFIRLAIPLAVLVVKELVSGIISLVMLRRGGHAMDSRWHGKAATVLLYATLFVHFIWADIPVAVSIAAVTVCVAAMTLSFVLYTVRNARIIREEKEKRNE